MASTEIGAYGSATFTVTAGNQLAAFGRGTYRVDQTTIYANVPSQQTNLFSSTGAYLSSTFAADTIITVTNLSGSVVRYNQGVTPLVYEATNYQAVPGTLNATGTLTAALIMGGVVTPPPAAAVTATLDTGTVMDAAVTMGIGDSFDWTAINTGGTNAFTVTASTGHTIVGAAAVANSTSGRFRTKKTAAATFVTYRLS